MDFASTLLTSENAPPRLVLDETSASMREVFEKACHAIMHGDKLAYVWRRNAQQVSATSVALAQGVFIPIANCARFWHDRKYSDDVVQFDVGQSVNRMVFGSSNNFIRSEAEFRVETFQGGKSQRYGDNFTLLLDSDSVNREKIQENELLPRQIVTYEYDCEYGYHPHIDGNFKFLNQAELTVKKLYLRVLTIHQGDGTRFWPDSLDKYGGEGALKNRNEVDPFYLEGKPSFHTQEGDIIIFNSKPVRLSHSFVHQARPSKSISTLQDPNIQGLRFVEVCDVVIPVSWSPPI